MKISPLMQLLNHFKTGHVCWKIIKLLAFYNFVRRNHFFSKCKFFHFLGVKNGKIYLLPCSFSGIICAYQRIWIYLVMTKEFKDLFTFFNWNFFNLLSSLGSLTNWSKRGCTFILISSCANLIGNSRFKIRTTHWFKRTANSH
jgi:hypothetical protein